MRTLPLVNDELILFGLDPGRCPGCWSDATRLGSSQVIEPLHDDAIDGSAACEALLDGLVHWLCTADGCLESCG